MVMPSDAVVMTSEGPVTTIVINRPDVRNAVDRNTAEALVAAFESFDDDRDSAVAVLTGSGGHFCAGADLTAIAAGRPNRLDAEGPGPMGPTRMVISKPVIAAVSGYAVAGGLELALWCDLRIADETAVFGVFCRRWGVPLIDGGTVRLPQIVGLGRALDMILTGRPVDASEAAAIGLVTSVVPDGEARPAAQRLAAELAALPQHCLRSDLASTRAGVGLPTSTAMATEFDYGMATIDRTKLRSVAGFPDRRTTLAEEG